MLVMTGTGGAESHVRKLLGTLGLMQEVVNVGRMVPQRTVLEAGDIYIEPRPSKAFNAMMLEAMSVGAVVAGCKGGVDDLIVENETAVTFDPDDELSIHDTLRGLFDQKETARQLARQAQTYLRHNHTVSQMVEKLICCYKEVAGWYNH